MRYPPDEFVGRLVLGRYRIVGVLAKGGMGVIYLARSEGAAGFVKPVVIKRILTDLGEDNAMVSMFKREARIMSNLRHPGIVSVIDFGRDHRAYFMVLDYVHGFHLGRWLRFKQGTSGPFPVDFAVHIVIHVLDALHYAHTLTAPDGTVLQVVHRDVTPSNVLIDVEGHVKLGDFGIARMRTDATDVGTGEATIKGKFPYLAPEILHGGDPSPVSDVYACGVVLHEALLGKNVFRAPNFSATVSRVLNHVPEQLCTLRDDVPPALDRIIQRALDKEASQRFASALEFAQALREIRKGNAEETQARMAKSVSEDFFDPQMAELLGADDLASLDRAWRQAPDTSSDFREATYVSSKPPPSEAFPSIPVVISEETEEDRRESRAAASAPRTTMVWLPWVFGIVAVIVAGFATAQYFLGRTKVDEGDFIVVHSDSVPEEEIEQSVPDDSANDKPAPSAETSSGPETPSKVVSTPKPRKPLTHKEPPRPNSSGKVDIAQLSTMVQRQHAELDRCFRTHGDSADQVVQNVSLRFSVAESGRVESAEVMPAEVASSALGQCLRQVASGIDFGPQPKALSFRIPVRRKAI